MDINCDGLTFDDWYKKVDRVILATCGVGVDDLADFPSYDLWADGVSPKEAAMVCLLEWNDFSPGDLL